MGFKSAIVKVSPEILFLICLGSATRYGTNGYLMKMKAKKTAILSLAIIAAVIGMPGADPGIAQGKLAKGDVQKIAEEAIIYGFPMVMSYGVYYESFVDKASSQYKAPFNELYNTARVYTPADTAVVTPNSDTPYSFIGMDLRAEPIVICNPDIEKSSRCS
jgi:hypothetical protein